MEEETSTCQDKEWNAPCNDSFHGELAREHRQFGKFSLQHLALRLIIRCKDIRTRLNCDGKIGKRLSSLFSEPFGLDLETNWFGG